MQEWPDGPEKHLTAPLGASLEEVMREGGAKLGIPVLPPGVDVEPLDALRSRKRSGP